MTKSTKVAAVNTSATRDHAALAGELSQLALQAGYLNQRSASLPNVMGLPDGCTAPLQDIILRAQSTAEAVDANQLAQPSQWQNLLRAQGAQHCPLFVQAS